MGYFSIQTITALVEVVTGGLGLGDRRDRIGIYRTGPELEHFLGAAGIELHIGSNSRVSSVRKVLITANENNPDAVVQLIEQVADPREYLSCPEKLGAVVGYLNARLRGDSYKLEQIDEVYKLHPFRSTDVVVSRVDGKVETQPGKVNSGNGKILPKKGIPVFPDITPSSIKESRFRISEKGDFVTDEDIQELVRLLFLEPEYEFYYFHEKGTKPDSLLQTAINRGDIRITETKFFYYKHPKIERDYVHIERPHGSYQWEWEKEVVEKGPMFCRSQLELSHRKKRELEIQQIKNALPQKASSSHVIKTGGSKDAKSEREGMFVAHKPWYKKRLAKIIGVLSGLVLITTLLINLKTIKEWFYPPRIQTSTSKERQLPVTDESKLSVSLKEICKDIDSRPLAQQDETEKQYWGLRIKRERLKVLEVEINPGDESIYNLMLTFPDQPTFSNSKWRILGTVPKEQYPQLLIAREGTKLYLSGEIETTFRRFEVSYIDLSNIILEFE